MVGAQLYFVVLLRGMALNLTRAVLASRRLCGSSDGTSGSYEGVKSSRELKLQ
jgi:hypothetical protein